MACGLHASLRAKPITARGWTTRRLGGYDEARDEWLRGIQEDPSYPKCWECLGDYYAQTRDYVEGSTLL